MSDRAAVVYDPGRCNANTITENPITWWIWWITVVRYL